MITKDHSYLLKKVINRIIHKFIKKISKIIEIINKEIGYVESLSKTFFIKEEKVFFF